MVSGRNLGQGGKFRGGESLRNAVSCAREKTKATPLSKSRHSQVCLMPFPEFIGWLHRQGLRA